MQGHIEHTARENFGDMHLGNMKKGTKEGSYELHIGKDK